MFQLFEFVAYAAMGLFAIGFIWACVFGKEHEACQPAPILLVCPCCQSEVGALTDGGLCKSCERHISRLPDHNDETQSESYCFRHQLWYEAAECPQCTGRLTAWR